MLACGLSDPLVQALAAIAKYIQPLLKTIQGMNLRLDQATR
jgi:FKBP12-rapamycin complex-associated protein